MVTTHFGLASSWRQEAPIESVLAQYAPFWPRRGPRRPKWGHSCRWLQCTVHWNGGCGYVGSGGSDGGDGEDGSNTAGGRGSGLDHNLLSLKRVNRTSGEGGKGYDGGNGGAGGEGGRVIVNGKMPGDDRVMGKGYGGEGGGRGGKKGSAEKSS